jgi:hypothetical protein
MANVKPVLGMDGGYGPAYGAALPERPGNDHNKRSKQSKRNKHNKHFCKD